MACTSVANSIVDLIVLIYSRIHYVQPNKIVDGLLFLGRSPNGVIKINRPRCPTHALLPGPKWRAWKKRWNLKKDRAVFLVQPGMNEHLEELNTIEPGS